MVKHAHFYLLVESTKILCKLYQHWPVVFFKFQRKFYYPKIRKSVKCHQNVITCMVYHNTYSYQNQFLVISFSIFPQRLSMDAQRTRRESAKNWRHAAVSWSPAGCDNKSPSHCLATEPRGYNQPCCISTCLGLLRSSVPTPYRCATTPPVHLNYIRPNV